MLRRTALAVLLVAAAFAPVAAHATVTPDNNYGTGGTATVPIECKPGTVKNVTSVVRDDGKVYVVAQCAAGWHRVIALNSDGTIDDAWGLHGRLNVVVPTECAGRVELHPSAPGSDDSVYMATARTATNGDLHVCLMRITRSGKLWWNSGPYGGVRHLDRTGGYNTFAGLAVEPNFIYAFTARQAGDGLPSAAFVNRYESYTGRPYTALGSYVQRAFHQPYQVGLRWGGVFGRRVVMAISVNNGHGLSGTQFVRFEYDGKLNKDFGGDGTVFVSDNSIGGAKISPDQIAMDANGRIVLAGLHDSPGDGNHWVDLFRMKRNGAQDTAFNGATEPITTLPGNHFTRVGLQVTPGHYAVGWDAGIGARTTGYDGTGARWTALGPNGTANVNGDLWAPDATTFYDFTNLGHPVTSVTVTRSTVS